MLGIPLEEDVLPDVIVLGLGGMGSATAAHLAARGASVLGLERFTPAHDRGSSHGETRMVRQAYFEHPDYVPLLRRAYELFEDLDGEDPGLLVETGGLMIGDPQSRTVTGTLATAARWDMPCDLLDGVQLRRRFPTFSVPDDVVGVFERRAGFVRPERTVRAHLGHAGRCGADLRFGEQALSWSADEGGVEVRTDHGTHHADRLVVTAGAWAPHLLADLGLPLVVERQVMFWFDLVGDPSRFAVEQHPVFLWEQPDGMQLYGFPAVDGPRGGLKTAWFRRGAPTDPDHLDREVHEPEIAAMRSALERCLPGAAGAFRRGVACLYTTTPDEHFVVALHPQHPNVAVGAGFSGHGFKFVPVVGEILAELALTGTTTHPIELFDPARFTATLGDPGTRRT